MAAGDFLTHPPPRGPRAPRPDTDGASASARLGRSLSLGCRPGASTTGADRSALRTAWLDALDSVDRVPASSVPSVVGGDLFSMFSRHLSAGSRGATAAARPAPAM